MTTGRDVYETALHLLGEDSENPELADYERRAAPLINLLILDLTPLDGRLKAQRGLGGPEDGGGTLNHLDDAVYLEEELAKGVLPFGLAARLLQEGDPDQAAKLLEQYEKSRQTAGRGRILPIRKVWPL